MSLCCYGCGQEALFKFKNGKECCSQHKSKCPAFKELLSQRAKTTWKELKKAGIKHRSELSNKREKDRGLEGICYYCGSIARHQLKNGRWCCQPSINQCPQLRRKNSTTRKAQIKENPEKWIKQMKANLPRVAWNKGKTAETDPRVRAGGQTLHERYKKGQLIPPQKGKQHTKQTKDKLSKIRIKYLQTSKAGFQDVQWYRIANIKGQTFVARGTWQRDFGQYLNKQNIFWKRNVYLQYTRQDGTIHRYCPDFFLPDYQLYVQVKGYFSAFDKHKMQLVKQQHKIKLRYIRQAEIDKIRKGDKISLQVIE